tara:strand:- start:7055 stop:7738 length:684 start_codon:yes stop_codon:yes gene_type:complete
MDRGIVFDLDDTLIDRTQAVVNFASGFWTDFHAVIEVDQAGFVAEVLRLDESGYAPRESFFGAIEDTFQLSSEETDRLQTSFYESAWRVPVVIPGTLESLVKLRDEGYRIGVVTNGRTETQTAKLEAAGFLPFIDVALISESFGAKKPDPTIFEAIIKQLNIEPNQSWFVGDHPRNDIWASKQLGFNTAWLHRDKIWATDTAECFDVSARDLKSVLQQIEGWKPTVA